MHRLLRVKRALTFQSLLQNLRPNQEGFVSGSVRDLHKPSPFRLPKTVAVFRVPFSKCRSWLDVSWVPSSARAVRRKGGFASSRQRVSSRFLPVLFLSLVFIRNSTANVVQRAAKNRPKTECAMKEPLHYPLGRSFI